MNDIGKKLYLRRKELGLTLEDVGNAVGVGKSTVRRWETGDIKNMRNDKVIALARKLQMDPIELVPYDGVEVTVKGTTRRLYATDSMPSAMLKTMEVKQSPLQKASQVVGVEEDPELKALLKLWKIAKPERRKDIIRIFKTMTDD